MKLSPSKAKDLFTLDLDNMLQPAGIFLALFWMVVTAPVVDTMDAKFTCREQATLYADGRYIGVFNWTQAVVLPDDATLVAISCLTNHIRGGLIGWVENRESGVVTDKDWKCVSKRNIFGWFMSEFDDSLWPNAREITDDQGYLNSTIEGVYYPPQAKWIWREGGYLTESIPLVYCRRRIGYVSGSIRCDDSSSIYVDGELVGTTSTWAEVWKGSFPEDANVVAIKCLNNLGRGGLIASFSNGIVTNRHWKCGYPVAGWMDIYFDDSIWLNARNVDSSLYEWEKKSSFPPEAKWIWVSSKTYPDEFREIVCRVLLKSPELYSNNREETTKMAPSYLANIVLSALLVATFIGFVTCAVYLRARKKLTRNRGERTCCVCHTSNSDTDNSDVSESSMEPLLDEHDLAYMNQTDMRNNNYSRGILCDHECPTSQTVCEGASEEIHC